MQGGGSASSDGPFPQGGTTRGGMGGEPEGRQLGHHFACGIGGSTPRAASVGADGGIPALRAQAGLVVPLLHRPGESAPWLQRPGAEETRGPEERPPSHPGPRCPRLRALRRCPQRGRRSRLPCRRAEWPWCAVRARPPPRGRSSRQGRASSSCPGPRGR